MVKTAILRRDSFSMMGGANMFSEKGKSRIIPIVIGFISAVPAGIVARVYGIGFLPRILLALLIAGGIWFIFQLLSGNYRSAEQKEQ